MSWISTPKRVDCAWHKTAIFSSFATVMATFAYLFSMYSHRMQWAFYTAAPRMLKNRFYNRHLTRETPTIKNNVFTVQLFNNWKDDIISADWDCTLLSSAPAFNTRRKMKNIIFWNYGFSWRVCTRLVSCACTWYFLQVVIALCVTHTQVRLDIPVLAYFRNTRLRRVYIGNYPFRYLLPECQLRLVYDLFVTAVVVAVPLSCNGCCLSIVVSPQMRRATGFRNLYRPFEHWGLCFMSYPYRTSTV